MAMQKLTTKEPTPDMAEVAIAAVEAVFDWKAYLLENFPDAGREIAQAEQEQTAASHRCITGESCYADV